MPIRPRNAHCLRGEDVRVCIVPMDDEAKMHLYIFKIKTGITIRLFPLVPSIRLLLRGGMGMRRTEFFREKYCTLGTGGSSST